MAKPTQPTPISNLALESVSGGMPENLWGGGAETIMGGEDTTPADPGTNDTFAGTFGNDVLDGGAGSDVVYARMGNDLIKIGGQGVDMVFGGAGDDTAVVNRLGDGSYFDGGPGNDVLRLTIGDDAISGEVLVIDSTTPYRIEGNQMIFDGPASGSVTWSGMTINFTAVEVIQAHGWWSSEG